MSAAKQDPAIFVIVLKVKKIYVESTCFPKTINFLKSKILFLILFMAPSAIVGAHSGCSVVADE